MHPAERSAGTTLAGAKGTLDDDACTTRLWHARAPCIWGASLPPMHASASGTYPPCMVHWLDPGQRGAD